MTKVRTLRLPAGFDLEKDLNWIAVSARLRADTTAGVPIRSDVKFLFIVFTNRSGSTFLAELLASTGYFSYPEESFNSDSLIAISERLGSDKFSEVLDHLIVERMANGWFCSKISLSQLCALGELGILGQIVDRSKFLVIERMDKIAQVVSWQIACQTGQFTSYHVGSGHAPSYNAEVLTSDLANLLQVETNTRSFFCLNGIVPFHISYELLLSDPERVGSALLQALGFRDLVMDKSLVQLKVQRTSRNNDWALQLRRSLRCSP